MVFFDRNRLRCMRILQYKIRIDGDIRENADDLGEHGREWEMRILSEKV